MTTWAADPTYANPNLGLTAQTTVAGAVTGANLTSSWMAGKSGAQQVVILQNITLDSVNSAFTR